MATAAVLNLTAWFIRDTTEYRYSCACFVCCRWSLGVTLWQMVAGNLPAWAEEQQHHHHHHHIHGRSQQEQQQGAGSAAGQEQGAASSSCSQSSDDSLVLPLEPAATHCHTTPKDLQFPPQFSKVS